MTILEENACRSVANCLPRIAKALEGISESLGEIVKIAKSSEPIDLSDAGEDCEQRGDSQ